MILEGCRAMANSDIDMDRKFRAKQACFVWENPMKATDFRVCHSTVVQPMYWKCDQHRPSPML